MLIQINILLQDIDLGFYLLHLFHIQVLIGVEKLLFFGVDNSSPVDLDNKKKSILVLSEGATHRLHDTMRITEAK